MNEYINEKLKKIEEIVDEYGFNMDKTLDMISAVQKMMELSIEMVQENEPYSVNKINNMQSSSYEIGNLYFEVENIMQSVKESTNEMISEDDAKNIHEKILDAFYNWHIFKDNGKVYIVNDEHFDNNPIPDKMSYQYLLDHYEMDNIIEYQSYLDALGEWKDSIKIDIENMGLLNENGEWNFYLKPNEIVAVGVSKDIINENLNKELSDDKFNKLTDASKVLDEAIKLGILTKDQNHSQNIFVFKMFDNGTEGFVSVNKLEAVIDLVNQGQVEMLAEEVKNVKENGYSKNFNTFIKNITIEDVDVYDKLDNLVGGGQISDDVLFIFDEKLQNKLAEKVVEYVKNNENARNDILMEMEKYSKCYNGEELKKLDYRNALYNCDGIYLNMISECSGIPVEELSKYEMNFDNFALNVIQNQELNEIEKIKKIAFKQCEKGLDYVHINSDENGISIVNPWVDPTGRFEVDPVEEYGAKAFKQFCNDMKEKMNDILSHTLKLKYDKFEKENQPFFDANKQKQLEAMTKLHNIGLDGDPEFRYQILSRLKQDCDYYLGNGNRFTKHLWASDEKEQIVIMRYLYDSFLEEDKPEWINIDMINKYEERMCNNIEEEEEIELE